jgi:hypothetical protein
MKKSLLKHVVAIAVAGAFASPVFAANIVLYDTTNSFATAPHGAEALLAFQKAANYWNQTLTNNANVRINISFAALDDGVLGSTGSTSQDVKVSDVYGALAHTGTSQLDQIAVAHLSKLNADGTLNMRVNGYTDAAHQIGVDTSAASRLASSGNYINQYLSVNTATVKALGLQTNGPANGADANITFSSNFAFDFNPTDGIKKGTYDFTAVAVHELGHALGFVSGTDAFDYLGGKGPGASDFNSGAFGSKNVDDFSIGSTLDLFRYGNTFNADHTRQLQWGANKTAFFSIDGQNIYNLNNRDQEAAFFSTGSYNGDGEQASHWKDNLAALDASGVCFQSTRSIGIMDPTMAACDTGAVSQTDLAAFDAMGWNLNQNILNAKTYNQSTSDIYKMDGLATVVAVPEPTTYAMLMAGLGLTGFMARRRKAKTNAV